VPNADAERDGQADAINNQAGCSDHGEAAQPSARETDGAIQPPTATTRARLVMPMSGHSGRPAAWNADANVSPKRRYHPAKYFTRDIGARNPAVTSLLTATAGRTFVAAH
jgi:hypothetical protein